MALYTVSSGTTINAQDVNQLVNVLQQQSGGQEIGKYFLAGSVYENGAVVSTWISTLSRGSTPVSVSVDTADQAPTSGMGTVSTGTPKTGGFQIYSLSTTGPNHNARAGGNYTVQYVLPFVLTSMAIITGLLGFMPHFI